MAKKPGILINLHGTKFIVYNDQPLLKEKSKVILHYIDDGFNLIKKEDGKPKIRIMDGDVYNEEMQVAKLIGHVD